MRRSQSASRSTSRSRACACAARWWARSTGWACCRWVRPGIGASGWASACATSASTTSSTPSPTRRGRVAQPHPEQGGDLVVARAPGAQLAAQLRARPLDQPALQRGVHVLVVGRRVERAGLDVGAELGQRVEHAGELGVGEQARPVQHPRVRHRAAHVVGREAPVEVRGLRQRRQRVGGAGREPPAPEPRASVGALFERGVVGGHPVVAVGRGDLVEAARRAARRTACRARRAPCPARAAARRRPPAWRGSRRCRGCAW